VPNNGRKEKGKTKKVPRFTYLKAKTNLASLKREIHRALAENFCFRREVERKTAFLKQR